MRLKNIKLFKLEAHQSKMVMVRSNSDHPKISQSSFNRVKTSSQGFTIYTSIYERLAAKSTMGVVFSHFILHCSFFNYFHIPLFDISLPTQFVMAGRIDQRRNRRSHRRHDPIKMSKTYFRPDTWP